MRPALVLILSLAAAAIAAYFVRQVVHSTGLTVGVAVITGYFVFGELAPRIGGEELEPKPVPPGTPPFRNPAVRRRLLSLLALMGASGYILLSLMTGDVATEDIREWVDGLGIWGPLLLIAILATAMVLAPIPNPPFMIAAGIVWGTVLGVVYAVIGQLVGSAIIFWISRKAGRRFIPRLVGHDAAEKIDRMAQDMGPQLVFFWRLMPISFDFAAYAAGLTNMSFLKFIVLVALGSIVPTTVVVGFGDSFDSSWTARLVTLGLIAIAVTIPSIIFYMKYRNQLPPPRDWLRILAGEEEPQDSKSTIG